MRISRASKRRGIAMIIVLIVITFLGILAGGFAYSMRIETKLARNTSFETDLEWLGRSGVEFARYVLAQQVLLVNEPWDSLNQKWAGGPAGTNEVLAAISLENNRLGEGTFSVKIIDMERKLNINTINEANSQIFHQALNMVGVDPGSVTTITDSLLDWIDPDQDPHLSGAEGPDYINNPNPGYAPYTAKDGPIDDISELLLIRGITPEMYWGPGGKVQWERSHSAAATSIGASTGGSVGLVDLFTSVSGGTVNINTASAQVLQMVLGIDPLLAQGIVSTRAGFDGVDGTEDDVPFRSVGELINVPGMAPQMIQQLQGVFTTRSMVYEVRVDAQINQYKRQFVALLRRNPGNPRDVQTLAFHWK